MKPVFPLFPFSYPGAILLLTSVFSLCFVHMGAFVKGIRISMDLLFGRAQHALILTQMLNMFMIEKVIPQHLWC